MLERIKKIPETDSSIDMILNRDLIENLPGVFYMYKPVENAYKFIAWNENSVAIMGYSSSEFEHMHLHDFFTNEEYRKIQRSVMTILQDGNIEIKSNSVTKNGKFIPMTFNGFKFIFNNEVYMMGTGIDISEQVNLRSQLRKSEEYKRNAIEELQQKNRELVACALRSSRNNEFISFVDRKINMILEKNTVNFREELTGLKKSLESNFVNQNSCELFNNCFTQVHEDFFINLLNVHPTLTRSEQQFCAYLRIRMSSHDILSVLNITKEGIKKIRYRIRKKIGLSHDDSLENYLNQF